LAELTRLRQARGSVDRDAGGVDFDAASGGSVVFELTDHSAAHHLCETLWRRWDAMLLHGDAVMLVTVALPEEPSDIDDLLHTVEDWLERRDLPLIRFRLDNRLYVLQRGGHIGAAGPNDS
jgi:hypothetical protein